MASSTSSAFSVDNTVSSETTKNMFLNECFADFQFFFNEDGVRKEIPAHKAVLAAASDVFASMLNGQWKEDNEVEIVDASFDAFMEFLQFLYLPKVNISAENVPEVIYLANKYNLSKCKELCESKIIQKLTLEDVCANLDLALLYDLSNLKDCCLKIISKETSKILATDGFLCTSEHSLKSILALGAIDCDEMEMFDASLKWAKHACETKKKDPSIIASIREELGDSLHAIRFGTMKPEEISKCISKNDGFFNQFELQDLFLTIGSDKTQEKIFKNKKCQRKMER